MTVSKEPRVKVENVTVRGNWWNKNQVTGVRRVSSGSVPTEDAHPSEDGTGLETRVEGAPQSPSFPGTPRRDVPSKGARIDD